MASQTFDKLRIGRKKRACTAFLAFCQKLYASYLLLHCLKTKKREDKNKKRDLMPRASITFGLLRPKAREKLRQRTEVQCRRELVVVFN